MPQLLDGSRGSTNYLRTGEFFAYDFHALASNRFELSQWTCKPNSVSA